MTRTLRLLLGAATVVATLDLVHKQRAITEQGGAVFLHDRPTRYVVAGAALSLAWAGAVALTRSTSIALFGGVVLGGAAGNLLSFALWPSLPGVPDPIVAGGLAFSLGAMGSRRHNFYNDAYRRAGYEDTAVEVQRLWLDGRRDEATARVPDEIVLQTNLLGTDAMVRARIRAYRDAGITTLRVEPDGATLDERLATLARLMDLVKSVDAERKPGS